jgi:RND family efflux transporter MFP subunit
MMRGPRSSLQAIPPLLVMLSLAACGGGAPPEAVESETVVPVKVEPAQTGDIQAFIHATGMVAPAPGAELIVIAPEPARIAEMPKAQGDAVNRGDILVRFEIPSTVAEVQRQRAEVTRAQALVENRRAAQSRARDLYERGIAARKEVEDADRDLADATASVQQAQAALAAAQTTVDRATVRAPFSGVVAKRLHNPGDVVEATSGDPVLRLIDPRRLEVVAAVPISDVARVTIGNAARLTSGTEAALRVASRPAQVDPGTATVPVRLAFTSPTVPLPVGAPVEVDLDAELHKGVVLVPAAAVVREGEETFVFIANGDTAERRTVMLGITDEAHAEVTSGIKAGDPVIVEGQAGLPDGATITTGGAPARAAAETEDKT